jgi:hypothetical protein
MANTVRKWTGDPFNSVFPAPSGSGDGFADVPSDIVTRGVMMGPKGDVRVKSVPGCGGVGGERKKNNNNSINREKQAWATASPAMPAMNPDACILQYFIFHPLPSSWCESLTFRLSSLLFFFFLTFFSLSHPHEFGAGTPPRGRVPA